MVVLNEREYAEELLQKDVTCRTAGHALHYIAKLQLLLFQDSNKSAKKYLIFSSLSPI